MFSQLTDMILEGIRSHGILAVILGVLVETIIVPLPSPLILMAAGYLLIPQSGIFQVLASSIIISAVAGITQTIGSFLLFYPGYIIGKPFIEKYERFHGVSWKDITQFQQKFGKGRREDFMIFFLRAIPIMPLSVVSGLAGVMKISPKRYAISTFLGTIPRNMILSLMGFFFGGLYHVIAGRLDHAETIMTILVVCLMVGYVIGHKAGLFSRMRREILR